jgi:hypothetical protein
VKVVYVPGPEHLDPDEALELAEAWLEREATDRRRVLVVVPVRSSPENAEILARIVSRYPWGTTQTVHASPTAPHIVLAVWPSSDMLEKISQLRPRAVCVVQWRDETLNWLSAQAAEDLSGKAPTLAPATIVDPVTRVAVESLTQSINLGNRLHQVEDRDMAVLTLHLLFDHDRRLDPDEVFRWAIANKWPDEGAENLRKLTSEVLTGKHHRTRTMRRYDDDVYRYWEKKARGEE